MPEASPTPEIVCPTTCPNRKGNGVTLFGWTIDPVELLLHLCIILVIGIPAVRNSTKDDFTVEDALRWIGAMGGAFTVARLSPTDRVNAYLNLVK